MLKLALILAVLPAVILGGRISFTQCNGGGPLPNWAEVEGCNESECVIVNGAEITLSAELPVVTAANTLKTRVAASWLIINQDLELPEHVINGCNSFPRGCPLEVGSTETLKNAFVVTASVSNISPSIEFSMTNEAGELAICVRTSVRLISG